MKLMGRVPVWFCVAALVAALGAASVTSNQQPYSDQEYNKWIDDFRYIAGNTASAEWAGTRTGDGVTVSLKYDTTPQRVRNCSILCAGSFFAEFPKENSIGVWVKDCETGQTLHYELYSRK